MRMPFFHGRARGSETENSGANKESGDGFPGRGKGWSIVSLNRPISTFPNVSSVHKGQTSAFLEVAKGNLYHWMIPLLGTKNNAILLCILNC